MSVVNTSFPSPLVSVVTPAFNAMPFLVETIESVRAQQYPNLEHILFDGGSTDGTLEVLHCYPELVWVSEPDRGQSDALNKGFRRARGEIIGWLNADDTYEPGAVATAVNFFQTYPEVDLVYSDLRIIDANGEFQGITRSQPFDLEKLLFKNFIKQPTVFMRRSVIEQLNGVNENLHYTMDREFWIRAGIAGLKLHYFENQTFANFRLIPGTKSYEQIPQFRAEWYQVLEKVFQTSALGNLSKSRKEEMLRKTKAQYHWANVILAIDKKARIDLLYHFYNAIRKDPSLIWNRGTWLIGTQGLLGIKIDRLRKFKKESLMPPLDR